MNTTVKTGPRRPVQARAGQGRNGQATGGQAAAGQAAVSKATSGAGRATAGRATAGQATAGQVATPPRPPRRRRRPLRAIGPGARAGSATAVTADRLAAGSAASDRRSVPPANRAAPAPTGRAAQSAQSGRAVQSGRAAQSAQSAQSGRAVQSGSAAAGQASRTAVRTAAGATRTTGPARTVQSQPSRPPAAGRDTTGAGRPPVSRTPFILLVLGLLGGGLLCLLVINTTLEAGSFKINTLQQNNAQAAQRVQQLQQQVATEESPSSIEQRALRLGLRMQPVLDFVDLRNDRSYTTPARVTGNAVSGYTP